MFSIVSIMVSKYGEVVRASSFLPSWTVNARKGCAHAGIKAIGVKTTVITSAIFAIGLFNLKKKKKKHEQMECLVIFCQEV